MDKEQIDKLNALMDLEIARKEAIHYIEMGTDNFAISKGEIEIRRKKEVKNERANICSRPQKLEQ